MDIIKVGLDFGTHQTKICIKTYPNEDKRHPIFEFFPFKDLDGKETYFLPSEIKINDDHTLTYGFTEYKKSASDTQDLTTSKESNGIDCFDINKKAAELYVKYAKEGDTTDDLSVIVEMLNLYQNKQKEDTFDENDITAKASYSEKCKLYRYFKQATFSKRKWHHDISCENLSIWYLAYVIFLLEEKYGTNFSINMGIPVGEKSFQQMKRYAATILTSAYHLVEEVYQNDLELFLNEKVEDLQDKTQIIFCSDRLKEEYNINIFPEAFAGLSTLTSMRKLSNGMSLLVDIGGGTTDISFFTIAGNKPLIYRYWSLPKGLNYVAEKSGFVYTKGDVSDFAKTEIIDDFLHDERNIIAELIHDLLVQLKKETSIPKSNLLKALSDRIIVYNGGGSVEKKLVNPISSFTDIKLMDATMWKETNLLNKKKVAPLSQLLTTAYGLSIFETDTEVTVSKFTDIFLKIRNDNEDVHQKEIIDKDMC